MKKTVNFIFALLPLSNEYGQLTETIRRVRPILNHYDVDNFVATKCTVIGTNEDSGLQLSVLNQDIVAVSEVHDCAKAIADVLDVPVHYTITEQLEGGLV